MKPLAVARSDSAGLVTIPMAFHANLPFPIQTNPRLLIELVYVPLAHNALGQAEHPQLWEGTLQNLSSLIHRLVSQRPGQPPYARGSNADEQRQWKASSEAALAREPLCDLRSFSEWEAASR